MKLAILVIIYNSSLIESLTINSLFKTKVVDDLDITLYIWNNGPSYLEKSDIDRFKEEARQLKMQTIIFQHIENIALSKIYNFILGKKGYDFTIIFDHDSIIAPSFFENILKNKSNDLLVPFIYDKNSEQIEYPLDINNNIIIEEGSVDINGLMSIGSGLAISAKLVHLFNKSKIDVFDEHFAFYGVDSMFFRNLWSLNTQQNIQVVCTNCILHSRSINEVESPVVKEKRKLERLYDFSLVQLHYFGKSRRYVFKKVFKKFKKKEISLKLLLQAIYCILFKKHPRSFLTIKNIKYQ